MLQFLFHLWVDAVDDYFDVIIILQIYHDRISSGTNGVFSGREITNPIKM